MLRNIIKEETKEIHKYVENLPIMTEIMSGKITIESYSQYLYQIYRIYQTIEKHPLYQELEWNISLSEKCFQDISLITSDDEEFELEITKIYCQYLEKIDTTEAIIAHGYVRYMADLMGGQIIKKRIEDQLPTSVYQIENSSNVRRKIIETINNSVNEKLLRSETHLAFLFYASILEKLK